MEIRKLPFGTHYSGAAKVGERRFDKKRILALFWNTNQLQSGNCEMKPTISCG